MKTFLLAFVCLTSAAAAHAQVNVSVGPRVGVNLANRHQGGSNDVGYRFGLAAGVQASFSWRMLAVQPALLFSQKGSDNGDPYYGERLRLNYLTLPLNFVFAPEGRGTGPQFFAGPYVGVLLGGTYTMSTMGYADREAPIYVASQIDLSRGGLAFRRFDAGLQAGLGFRFERVVLQAEYSWGLLNHDPTYISPLPGVPPTTPTTYNRAFQGSVTYLFDLTH